MSHNAAPPRRAIAYFDLDGTLLTVNSGALWMRRERRLGRLSIGQYARGGLWLLAYRFSAIDMDALLDQALVTIANLEDEAYCPQRGLPATE